jgi:3-hydroxybutyryl-CoA dehydratase
MIGKTIDQISVGDAARFTKTIGESDIYLYAGITGDFNPAHVNEEFASKTFFKTRIAHGMLSAGLISTLLGTVLPGPGTIYLKQELEFTAPVKIGDTVTARVEVTQVEADKNRVTLDTTAVNSQGKTVIQGRAAVLAPKALKE